MKISGVDIRPGNIIEYENGIWRAVKTQHTQPGKGGAYMQVEMKNLIDGRKTVREQYTLDLIGRGELTAPEAEAAERDFHDQMESVFNEVKETEKAPFALQEGITKAQEVPHGLKTNITREELVGPAA